MLNCDPDYIIEVTAKDAKEFLRIIQKDSAPELIILTVQNLPSELSDSIKIIHKQLIKVKIIVIDFNENNNSEIFRTETIYNYLDHSSSTSDLFEAIQEAFYNQKYTKHSFKMEKGGPVFQIAEKPHITSQEENILRLMAQGKTSKQIARELYISKLTVDTHRKHLHKKLNILTPAGLIKYAIEHIVQ